MKKYLNFITIIFVSNMLISIANAGSDGSLEIKNKSSSGEINDCFHVLSLNFQSVYVAGPMWQSRKEKKHMCMCVCLLDYKI